MVAPQLPQSSKVFLNTIPRHLGRRTSNTLACIHILRKDSFWWCPTHINRHAITKYFSVKFFMLANKYSVSCSYLSCTSKCIIVELADCIQYSGSAHLYMFFVLNYMLQVFFRQAVYKYKYSSMGPSITNIKIRYLLNGFKLVPGSICYMRSKLMSGHAEVHHPQTVPGLCEQRRLGAASLNLPSFCGGSDAGRCKHATSTVHRFPPFPATRLQCTNKVNANPSFLSTETCLLIKREREENNAPLKQLREVTGQSKEATGHRIEG